MGEAKKRRDAAAQETLQTLGVEAVGGRLQVQWKQGEAATRFGQMAYFAEFLNLTGLYRRWTESCPLHFASPNGSKIADVLGTLFLSVLAGHWRYAHIAALRADGVSANLLGMDTVVSEDTVRRALKSMDEDTGVHWLQQHLDAKRAAVTQRAMGAGHRRHRQTLVWQARRCGGGLQPTQAGTPLTRLPHLSGSRTTANAGRECRPRQREPSQHHPARIDRTDRALAIGQKTDAGARLQSKNAKGFCSGARRFCLRSRDPAGDHRHPGIYRRAHLQRIPHTGARDRRYRVGDPRPTSPVSAHSTASAVSD